MYYLLILVPPLIMWKEDGCLDYQNIFENKANVELIQLLENLYKHTTTALAETPENKFEVNTGVR